MPAGNHPTVHLSRRQFLARSTSAATALLAGRRAAWAADTAGAAPLRLAFFTDVHTRLEWDTPQALQLAAAAINAERPDMILCGGDVITEGYESASATVAPRWDAYSEHLHRRLAAPVHVALGNHDVVAVQPADGAPAAADPRAEFRARFGLARTYYSFDHRGHHVIVLDPLELTTDELRYRGFVSPDQLAWLRADVQVLDPRTPIILMTHIPLLTAFYQATAGATTAAPANRVVVNSADVLAALADRNLLLVLQGHLHVNELLRWRDTTFITGGAVCGKWWRGGWHGTEEGFGMVEIAAGRVDWRYVDYGWQARRPAGV
jgi:Icc protein